MKTGPERPRLSERLQAMQETTEAPKKIEEAAALMTSQLESFRRDCEILLSSALDTMKADTSGLIDQNRREIVRTVAQIRSDLNLIGRLTRFGPWATAILLMALIVASFAASWFWERSLIREVRDSTLAQIGLNATPTKNGFVLSWNPARLKLTECRTGSQPVPCLMQIGER